MKEAFDILHKVDVSDVNIINYEAYNTVLNIGASCGIYSVSKRF